MATSDVPAATGTAREVDTRLEELHVQYGRAQHTLRTALDRVHRYVGDRQVSTGRGRRTWGTSDQDALAQARTTVTGPGEDHTQLQQLLRAVTVAQVDVQEHAEAINALEEVWSAHPWSRFFLVPDGHIHASRSCSTLRPTTVLGWLPALSGLSDADAVSAHGPLLCSRCFPDAPVAWTLGAAAEPDPAVCTGSGQAPVDGSTVRRAYSRYGTCPACNTQVVVTSNYVLRKHKRPTR